MIRKAIIAIFMFVMGVFALAAQDLTGLDIVTKAHNVPEPETSSVNAKLVIHSKKGNEKTRQVIMKTKDYGDVTKKVIVFTSPKDVAGVGYLMFDYEEDSDNWLYMPAMKKTKRIASSGTEAEGSFMGTDFTYEDMGERVLSKDSYTLLGTETVNGVSCYKVKCQSKERTEADPDRVVYIGTEDYLLYKCEYYDRHGSLHRVLTCSDIQYIDGFACTKIMRMENVQSGTWSEITMSDVAYNSSAIDDKIFTVSALEQGRIR